MSKEEAMDISLFWEETATIALARAKEAEKERDEARAESARLAAALKAFANSTNWATVPGADKTKTDFACAWVGPEGPYAPDAFARKALTGSRAALDAAIEAAVKPLRERLAKQQAALLKAQDAIDDIRLNCECGEAVETADCYINGEADEELRDLLADERRKATAEALDWLATHLRDEADHDDTGRVYDGLRTAACICENRAAVIRKGRD